MTDPTLRMHVVAVVAAATDRVMTVSIEVGVTAPPLWIAIIAVITQRSLECAAAGVDMPVSIDVGVAYPAELIGVVTIIAAADDIMMPISIEIGMAVPPMWIIVIAIGTSLVISKVTASVVVPPVIVDVCEGSGEPLGHGIITIGHTTAAIIDLVVEAELIRKSITVDIVGARLADTVQLPSSIVSTMKELNASETRPAELAPPRRSRITRIRWSILKDRHELARRRPKSDHDHRKPERSC